jgi:predicted DCC family thiol-disulfide oxidoreductase YuxK
MRDAVAIFGTTHVLRVFYDGQCSFCRGLVRRFGPRLERSGFEFVTLQSQLGTTIAADGLDEMKVTKANGAVLGGAAAVAYLARYVWWAKPLAWAWLIPPLRPLFRAAYRWVARHRGCTTECHI